MDQAVAINAKEQVPKMAEGSQAWTQVEFGAEIFHRLFPRKGMRHRRALLLQGLKRQEYGDIDVFFDCLPRPARELRAAAWLLRHSTAGGPFVRSIRIGLFSSRL